MSKKGSFLCLFHNFVIPCLILNFLAERLTTMRQCVMRKKQVHTSKVKVSLRDEISSAIFNPQHHTYRNKSYISMFLYGKDLIDAQRGVWGDICFCFKNKIQLSVELF